MHNALFRRTGPSLTLLQLPFLPLPLTPNGVKDGSRGLSEAIPPVKGTLVSAPRRGARTPRNTQSFWHPLRGAEFSRACFRGCSRSALDPRLPSANPSGSTATTTTVLYKPRDLQIWRIYETFLVGAPTTIPNKALQNKNPEVLRPRGFAWQENFKPVSNPEAVHEFRLSGR